MKIRVRYFASIRESLGKSEDEIEIKDGLKLSNFIEYLSKIDKVSNILFNNKRLKDGIIVSYNATTVNRNEFDKIILKDGDEIAFLPFIAGG
jgi:MoaD family protein, archaeal